MNATSDKLVILGVTGSIAAYKSPQLLRLLKDDGFAVRVAMTRAACHFVGPLTFDALGGGPVYRDQLEIAPPSAEDETQPSSGIAHTDLTAAAAALVVAPASADIIAKIAHGFGDDPVCAIALALKTDAALVVAPSMNPRMWANPAVRANIATLRDRGAVIVGPGEGETACGDFGSGRMSEPEEIAAAVRRAIARKRAGFAERRVLVLSGPTREPIDGVRFLSNGSSGRMGRALAEAAFEGGHDITVVSGPAEVPPPPWVRTIRVGTAQEMLEAAAKVDADLVVSPAAIADMAPARSAPGKPAKAAAGSIAWVATPDVLAALSKAKPNATIVAFAAEENGGDVAAAVAKAKRKCARFIVLNAVFETMGSENAMVRFIDAADGSVSPIGPASKKLIAAEILRLASPKA